MGFGALGFWLAIICLSLLALSHGFQYWRLRRFRSLVGHVSNEADAVELLQAFASIPPRLLVARAVVEPNVVRSLANLLAELGGDPQTVEPGRLFDRLRDHPQLHLLVADVSRPLPTSLLHNADQFEPNLGILLPPLPGMFEFSDRIRRTYRTATAGFEGNQGIWFENSLASRSFGGPETGFPEIRHREALSAVFESEDDADYLLFELPDNELSNKQPIHH